MGYHTDFKGSFEFNKELSPKMNNFLKAFNESRRMKRNVDDAFGIQGEFYAIGGGSFGQNREDNIVDYNTPPSTQPGLWCQWTPTEDGLELEWDGGEKFYNYTEWLFYLINKVLEPNGYILNGIVEYQGEEIGDNGEIEIVNNHIRLNGVLIQNPKNRNYDYNSGSYIESDMKLDTVLILDNVEKLIPQTTETTETVPTKEEVDAATDAVKAGVISVEDYTEIVKKFTKSLVD